MGNVEDELGWQLYWRDAGDGNPGYRCIDDLYLPVVDKEVRSWYTSTGIQGTEMEITEFKEYLQKRYHEQKLENIEFIYQMWKINQEEDVHDVLVSGEG